MGGHRAWSSNAYFKNRAIVFQAKNIIYRFGIFIDNIFFKKRLENVHLLHKNAFSKITVVSTVNKSKQREGKINDKNKK